ncbi:heme-binding protein [Anaerolineales bacterium HSG25]|nr:heme-binding protein [Anaerolineales bacterium HSG25]
MYQTYQLSHTEAMTIIQAIQAEVEKEQLGAAIAVVDAHGELVAFLRTDGCRLPSLNIAIAKAFTAAREQIETGVLGERAKTEGFPMTNFGDLRYVSWGGGIPILHDNQIIGAVGVSGLPEDKDVILARLGAELVGA